MYPNYNANMGWPHMTVKDWMLCYLILLIPCVNIVMIFVWAFSDNENPSKRSYFQASLIWALIVIVIYAIIFAICAAAGVAINLDNLI
ncbi:MAG: hypothetical protein IJS61_07470 [Firmicutes bacterium]|nr:hypothetical protein [Bacillota bacterium]